VGYEKMLHSILYYDNPRIDYKLEIIGVKPGAVMAGKDFAVRAFRLKHSVGIVGYTFREKDKVRFLAEKCKKLGIKGEMYQELLKKGKLSVNGKAINIKDISFTQEGRMFAYATDTRPSPEAARAFAGADLLVHEATYDSSNTEKAREYMHSMAEEVARLAKRAKVKRLVMTHLSARYTTPETLIREAKAVFRNSEFAEDGTEITI
jgi:ribonuclease Z